MVGSISSDGLTSKVQLAVFPSSSVANNVTVVVSVIVVPTVGD